MSVVNLTGERQPPAWLRNVMDLSVPYEQPEPIMTLTGRNGEESEVFCLGGISTIMGHDKSGKSHLISLFIQMAFVANESLKILLIDTEQGGKWVRYEAERVHKMMQWGTSQSDERFIVIDFREYTPNERLLYTGEAIEYYKPDLVFIDGIKDLCPDPNDQKNATELTTRLMQWTTGEKPCHICVVIHLNKNNEEARGALGTELYNKSECVILTKKIDNAFSVSCSRSRGIGFEDVVFQIREDGIPYFTNIRSNITPTRLIIEQVLKPGENVSYTDLTERIREHKGVGVTQAKTYIKTATANNIIIKDSANGMYKLNGQDSDPF